MTGVLVFCLMSLLLSACSEPSLVKASRPYLGTFVEITVAPQGLPSRQINQAIEQAFARIKSVEDLLSRFNPTSDISRINQQAHVKPARVSSETISLIEQSNRFARLTGGCFDITVFPVMQAWGLAGENRQKAPSDEELKQSLDRVGYQKIKIDAKEGSVFLPEEGMSLDLGAVAKGYAVDRAIAVLKQEGINNALVNAGGDIYAWGRRTEGRKWRIALKHPRQARATLTTLDIQDQACATSGDYQKYINVGASRYSHIINPKTGLPCQDAPCSVTVLAGDCLSADALSTAIFVLGAEKGIDLINQLDDTEAIVVTSRAGELDIGLSQGLQGKIEFNP